MQTVFYRDGSWVPTAEAEVAGCNVLYLGRKVLNFSSG